MHCYSSYTVRKVACLPLDSLIFVEIQKILTKHSPLKMLYQFSPLEGRSGSYINLHDVKCNLLLSLLNHRKNYYQGEGDAENTPKDVNYAAFLYHIVPELAFAKSIDEEVVTDRISRHHMPNPMVERKISFKRSMSSTKSLPSSPIKKVMSNTSFKVIDEVIVEEKQEGHAAVLDSVRDVVHETNADLDMNIVLKNQAAVKIQSKFRCRIAKRVAFNLKQVSSMCFRGIFHTYHNMTHSLTYRRTGTYIYCI